MLVSGHSHPPKPPVLWLDILGRSQLSAAPDLLPQCKKRLLVSNITETRPHWREIKTLGMGMAKPPIRSQIGGFAFRDRRSSPTLHTAKLACLNRVFALRLGFASDDVTRLALRPW